tara:strand:+ start:22316 stop:22855 length:540 start_codon:yes stop_codon:yes gene_type:complete
MELGLGATRVHSDPIDNCTLIDYDSDFSAGKDNFADASGANITLTVTGNNDSIGGLNDALKVVINVPDPTAIFVSHNPIRGTNSEIQAASPGCTYAVRFRVFFPTGNTTNGLKECRINGGELVDMGVAGKSLNTWHTTSIFNVVAGNTPGDGLEIGLQSIAEVVNSDEVYIRDIQIDRI